MTCHDNGVLIYFDHVADVEKDNSFLRIGSLRIGSLLGVNTKLPQIHHHQIRSSAPPSSFDIKLHKNWGSADNVLPHSVSAA